MQIVEFQLQINHIFIFSRSCTKDCTIKGIPFKKGTGIQLAILPAHLDPEFYPEPEKFQPERFMKENSDKIVPYTWRPFGAGNRNCIGQRFSMTEMKLCMAKMIKEFQERRVTRQ